MLTMTTAQKFPSQLAAQNQVDISQGNFPLGLVAFKRTFVRLANYDNYPDYDIKKKNACAHDLTYLTSSCPTNDYERNYEIMSPVLGFR